MKKLLTKEELEKLTTKRLLAYKQSLLIVYESPDLDNPHSLSKESEEWKACYKSTKDILATREHIEKRAK